MMRNDYICVHISPVIMTSGLGSTIVPVETLADTLPAAHDADTLRISVFKALGAE
jgi:hypothetical protein